MKPSEKQQVIIQTLESEINYWKNTNDINSPTHIVDIRECILAALSDIVSEEDIDCIEENLIHLLKIVRKYGTLDSKK